MLLITPYHSVLIILQTPERETQNGGFQKQQLNLCNFNDVADKGQDS